MDMVIHAFEDTVKMLPFLAVIYSLIGFLEYRYGARMGDMVMRFGMFAPIVGAALGCIPQCGFSVIAAALYVKRLISVGTLLAVFLSTSDEAIPVFLSMPDKVSTVGFLISVKVLIAVVAGISIDLFLNGGNKTKVDDASSQNVAFTHPGCCAHDLTGHRSVIKAVVYHPLQHTLKIFIFLLTLTVVLNFMIEFIGADRMARLFLFGHVLQPVAASLIGLIPNCFASVFLVELFDKSILGFGSLVAGLCSSAGLGLLVLVKENKNYKNTLFIIVLLLSISISSGVVIYFLKG